MRGRSSTVDLMQGPIARGLVGFAIPFFLGQLLQQLYNTADAWVIGNFADETSLAGVTSVGSLTFLIVGFFNGIAIGGGVVISKYFGMKDRECIERSVHGNFLFGILASVLATAVGVLLAPLALDLLNTPVTVRPKALEYIRIYFAGISTVVMYNICMSIMRALGDSIHPLYYLIISSLTNVVLDLLFVAVFHWGVSGAAAATVLGQGLSCVLCILRMCRSGGETGLDFRKLKFDRPMLKEILANGLPTGIQNSVISIGNMTVQGNINLFDITHEGGLGLVIAGQGAYTKIEGFVFLPITCMSMSLPTFISQNLGAGQYERAKKGAVFGILCGVILAEVLGAVMHFGADAAVGFFTDAPVAIRYGALHARTVCWFYCLLAFSHCASGVLRGCGKSTVPMISMLSFWCVFRVIYVTVAIRLFPAYSTIAWAYPITWTLSSILLAAVLLKSDWTHGLEKQRSGVRNAKSAE